MPTNVLTINSNLAPGVYVQENTAGTIPFELASFNRAYIIGTATAGDFNTPIQILDGGDFGATDLVNQVTSTPSGAAIKGYFYNNPNGVLFFVRGKSPQIGEIEITLGVDPTGVFSFTIAAETVSYTAVLADTLQDVIDGLITDFNANATLAATYLAYDDTAGDGTFKVRGLTPDAAVFTIGAPTAPVDSTMTDTDDITTAMDDFKWAVETAFDPEENEAGFLICPEGFQTLTTSGDRVALGTAMEAFAVTNNWVALVDAGPAVSNHAMAVTDGQLYSSEIGSTSYYGTYLTDLDSNSVPASPFVAGVAIRRYKQQGFQQPPAGAQFPVRGVTGVKFKVTSAEQEVGNPLGINVARMFINRGVLIWGARTRSGNEFYRFVSTRVIMNVLAITARRVPFSLVFSSVDGQGEYYTRLKESLIAVCHLLWRGGALYGATPQDAYAVVCDGTINQGVTLEQGVVLAEIYAAPSPISERIIIGLYRTAIGQVQTVVNQRG